MTHQLNTDNRKGMFETRVNQWKSRANTRVQCRLMLAKFDNIGNTVQNSAEDERWNKVKQDRRKLIGTIKERKCISEKAILIFYPQCPGSSDNETCHLTELGWGGDCWAARIARAQNTIKLGVKCQVLWSFSPECCVYEWKLWHTQYEEFQNQQTMR